MCITTVDVTKIICLFYLKVSQLIASDVYGVECDEKTLLAEIKKLLTYYEMNCYYSDFIREYVDDNEGDLDLCTRYTTVEGIPE